MNIRRPQQTIRVKALGLHWRGDRLLVAEVPDDTGAPKGVRPLGGTVEFGESWHDALIREFAEEMGVQARVTGAPQVFENIYTHHGMTGHEVVFAAEVAFDDSGFADRFTFAEDNGAVANALWIAPQELRQRGIALFPTALGNFLGN
ncbi:NUDIX domain-containing protein [Donghicola sp. C2-DW-16]|uniref:NUDIX domain-containing protein n=1 Tax=Donghicola mangrovi TaxID=2729614 RepID=A0ABX2PE96_9RHOB|nr:NUDIX domain-containing protein [Donghicola mangrovi]NVO27708.1 NUDIX domain-containing protein [Donghicola mangrovi]